MAAIGAPGHTGILTCEDGNGIPVYRKRARFTDFPSRA